MVLPDHTEVIPADAHMTFRSLEEAERDALHTAFIAEDQRIRLARICKAIRDQKLWRGANDPDTGVTYHSFEHYLKTLIPRLQHINSKSRGNIFKTMAELAVYEEQLGYDSNFISFMGSHGACLLRCANLSPRGSILQERTIESQHGGELLGTPRFKQAVEYIASRLKTTQMDVGFPAWRFEDTKAYVDGILGISEKIVAEWSAEVVELPNQRYVIKAVHAEVDGRLIEIGSPMNLETLRLVLKPFRYVDGMPDGWRE